MNVRTVAGEACPRAPHATIMAHVGIPIAVDMACLRRVRCRVARLPMNGKAHVAATEPMVAGDARLTLAAASGVTSNFRIQLLPHAGVAFRARVAMAEVAQGAMAPHPPGAASRSGASWAFWYWRLSWESASPLAIMSSPPQRSHHFPPLPTIANQRLRLILRRLPVPPRPQQPRSRPLPCSPPYPGEGEHSCLMTTKSPSPAGQGRRQWDGGWGQTPYSITSRRHVRKNAVAAKPMQ